ncbi:sugar ABC transporter substrate-binding protein [Phytoactinopolyspora alkaliphila]|uniref:Sugar ABC transporter substrate-binding protein n=1 Tax=Phytoactinopolyspora alkaliphila TaxID=1783498 RepID=A0A6N9YRU6_9ACTN|nr:sugar ABC transporter substrate-binding protein [Phytoactinopolyspora alkaliphila]NED97702.1 sugar ABC transporter substrate-binding protein [Phytoactinopolyspora alkaliphila]
MKTRTLVSGALVAAVMLAACGRDDGGDGGDAPGDAAPAPEVTGPVEGEISVWAMGTEGEHLDVLADEFMAEHPEVTVSVTAVPWDAAHDRIVNAIAGGQVPDVSQIGTTWMGEFAAIGGLERTPDSIDPGQFFEGAWDTTVVDGVSYGVPWYVETRLLYYRTDLAEEAGFTEPPTSWDELKQMAEGMTDAGAQYGLNLQPGGAGAWQMFMPFFWQQGGEIVDDSGAFTLDSPACVDAMTYYNSYFEEELTPRQESDVPIESQFADGEVGAFISGPWMVGIVDEAGADPDAWTVAHQPVEQSGTSFVGGANLGVFSDSDNKPAAWAFVEYVSQPEVQATWYETVNALPAVQAAWDDPALSGDELLTAFGDQLEDAKAPPAIPNWEQVASAIDSQIEQVAVGGVAPEDSCAAMQQEAEAIGTGL